MPPEFTDLEIALLEKLLELKTQLVKDSEEVISGYTCQDCGRTLSKKSKKGIKTHEESKYHLDRVKSGLEINFNQMGRSKPDA